MALFDSDILFLPRPQRICSVRKTRIMDATPSMLIVGDGYTVEPETVRELIGHELVPFINTGFGLVHRKSINWQWTEEFSRYRAC